MDLYLSMIHKVVYVLKPVFLDYLVNQVVAVDTVDMFYNIDSLQNEDLNYFNDLF